MLGVKTVALLNFEALARYTILKSPITYSLTAQSK